MSVKRERAKRRARRAAVDAELNFERENAHVARLLNSLPSNAFADYSKNIQRARKYVLSNMVGLKRNHQLRILNELQVYFAPAYRQVPNSERLFPIGNSAVYLTRKVRAILFDTRCPTGTCCMTRISCENGNCRKAATIWKADLSNAHLVIAARLWGLEGILSLLKREKSIWPYLLRELQLTLDAKDDLKEIIYATVYGMHETNVKGMITREFGREVTDRYFRLELIAQLFAAREIHMSRIKNDGFICDAFGKKHFLSDVSRGSPLPEEEKGAEDKAVRTLVSHEVGSYELRVMAAASKIVKDAGREVVIILWLHDGIYVKFKDTRKSRMDTWKKRIKHAVEAEARALNLPLILVDE